MPLSPGLPLRAELQVPGWGMGAAALACFCQAGPAVLSQS